MTLAITIDNDRVLTGIQPLIDDESAGVQTPSTTDKGNEIDVTLSNTGVLGGFGTGFDAYLNTLSLTTAQKEFARDHDGASSESDFVKVTVGTGETVSDLKFSAADGSALVGVAVAGVTDLNGNQIYLWTYGDTAIAATKVGGNPGTIVAAFYLNENTTNHLTAQVQMVTFEPLKHLDTGSVDEAVDFSEVLQVRASGSKTFDLNGLDSGDHLWCAVGDSSSGIVITSNTVAVDAAGKKTNANVDIHTSQGGDGTTIGVGNQLFDNAGETAVFTFVTGLSTLGATTTQAVGDSVVDPKPNDNKPEGIDYNGYDSITGAGIYLSQSQGTPTTPKNLDIDVFSASGGTQPEDKFAYVYSDPVAKTGNALANDTPVNVTTVTIFAPGSSTPLAVWAISPSGAQLASGASIGGVTVTISGNHIEVDGVNKGYIVDFTTSTAFNRFSVSDESGAFDIGKVFVTQGAGVSANVGDFLHVQDDGPSPSTTPFIAHVDEDAMTGAANGDLSTGNVEAGDDGDGTATEQDEVTFSQADLGVTVNSGTDAPAIFSLNLGITNGTAVTTTSGANVLSKGQQVVYKVVNGVIQGVTGFSTPNDATDDRIVFTITVNTGALPNDPSDDTFTFDLKDQLDHASGAGDLSNLLLNLTPAFLAKDADLDPVNFGTTAAIRMQVENDVPKITAQIADGTVEFTVGATGTTTHSLNGAVGGDDNSSSSTSSTGAKQYVITSFTTPTDVYPDLTGVYSADHTSVTYYSTSVVADQDADTAVYQLSLNQTANNGAGSYTFTVLQPPPDNSQHFDFTYFPSGSSLFGVLLGQDENGAQSLDSGLLVIGADVVLDPVSGQALGGTDLINTSQGGVGPVTIGANNQLFDKAGDGVIFVYLDHPDERSSATIAKNTGLTQTTADDADALGFHGTLESFSASIDIVQIQGGSTNAMKLTAYNIDPNDAGTSDDDIDSAPDPLGGITKKNTSDDKSQESRDFADDVLGGSTQESISAVQVYNTGDADNPKESVTINQTTGAITVLVDDPNISVTAVDSDNDGHWEAVVTGFGVLDTVAFQTVEKHDAVQVDWSAGAWDIGGFSIDDSANVDPQNFDFSVSIRDYDNDVYGGPNVTFANFSVDVAGVIL